MTIGDLELLALAWPDGVPEEEVVLLASLPRERAEQVLGRLRRLLVFEDRLAAEEAPNDKISRSGWFDLRRRWSAQRTLEVLTPYQRAPGTPTIDRGGAKRVANLVSAVTGETPSYVSDNDLAREIVRRSDGPLSYDAALRLVRRERRLSARSSDALRESYGRTLLIDLCAIDVALIGADGTATVVALVVEEGSRLVIGTGTGVAGEGIAIQARAIASAILYLAETGLDRAVDGLPTRTIVVLGDAAPRRVATVADALADHDGVELISTGTRRFGVRLASLFNRSLGGLRLLPRSTATGVLGAMVTGKRREPVTLNQAGVIVAAAVERHNAEIATIVRGAESAALRLSDRGAMAAKLAGMKAAFGLDRTSIEETS